MVGGCRWSSNPPGFSCRRRSPYTRHGETRQHSQNLPPCLDRQVWQPPPTPSFNAAVAASTPTATAGAEHLTRTTLQPSSTLTEMRSIWGGMLELGRRCESSGTFPERSRNGPGRSRNVPGRSRNVPGTFRHVPGTFPERSGTFPERSGTFPERSGNGPIWGGMLEFERRGCRSGEECLN